MIKYNFSVPTTILVGKKFYTVSAPVYDYDAAYTYAKDDLVEYKDELWKCTTAGKGTAPDSGNFEKVANGSEVTTVLTNKSGCCSGSDGGDGGGPVDAYTKAEADGKFASKTALNSLLPKTEAEGKYATKESVNGFLPKTEAERDYLKKTDADGKYAAKNATEGLLPKAEAASTYHKKSDFDNFKKEYDQLKKDFDALKARVDKAHPAG